MRIETQERTKRLKGAAPPLRYGDALLALMEN